MFTGSNNVDMSWKGVNNILISYKNVYGEKYLWITKTSSRVHENVHGFQKHFHDFILVYGA